MNKHSRRRFMAGVAATVMSAPSLVRANAGILVSQTELPPIPRRFMPRLIEVSDEFREGEIYVYNHQYFLYHIVQQGVALRYGVALGAQGREFRGIAVVDRKAEWPRWTPTANMIAMEPEVYGPFRNGLPGGHQMNPMGSAALYLSINGQPSYYRIHGTNLPTTIGTSFSSGCIRLRNDHMLQLYGQVPVGTRVNVFA